MYKKSITAVILACLVSISQLSNAQGNFTKQVSISIKLLERVAKNSPIKILADSTIVSTVGKSFTMHSGGTVKPKLGEGELEFGTKVTGKLSSSDDDTIQVALEIRLGTHMESDAKTDIALSETLEIRTLLKPGKTRRFHCNQSRWCEVRIEEVKLPPLGKGKAKLSEGDILTVTFLGNEPELLLGKRKEKLGSPPYRLAAKVVKVRPNGAYEIESRQKSKHDSLIREVRLTGSVPAASISAKRIVPLDEIANLDVNVLEIESSK